MTKMTSIVVGAILATAQVVVAQVTTPKKPSVENPGLTVSLKLSVEVFDPSKPKGTIACWFTNKSDKDITLPAQYGGDAVVLTGGRVRLSRRDQPAKDDKQKVVVIKPVKEELLFELVLAEILASPRDKERPGWAWTWDRRPEPPRSPIHKYRMPGYEETATFVVEVQAGSAKVASNPVTLKVRDSGDAPK